MQVPPWAPIPSARSPPERPEEGAILPAAVPGSAELLGIG
jgi:hypothetical protein